MDTMNNMSEESEGVVGSFMRVLTAAVVDPGTRPDTHSIDVSHYKIMCQEYLGDTLLLNRVVDDRVTREIEQNAHVKVSFPAGHRCCIAIVPFDNYGNPLTPEQIKRGDHLRTFIVNSKGVTEQGMSAQDSFEYDILPDEIQSLAFPIPEDPVELARLYRAACVAMGELLK